MSQQIQIGNLARIRLHDQTFNFIVRKIENNYVYISPNTQPEILSALYLNDLNEWKVYGAEQTPYQIEFLSNKPEGQFLDIFTYEKKEIGEQTTIFRDCKILKNLENFKIGDQVPAITIEVQMRVWTHDDDFEEEYLNI